MAKHHSAAAFTVVLALTSALWPAAVLGHPGGLDSAGCHAGSQPYHCHRTTSAPAPTAAPPAVPAVPVAVGSAANTAGTGAWVAYANGTVQAVGGAVFHGDAAGYRLNAPIVGMASTAEDGGY